MKIFKTPFAATGDKIAIPTVEQPSGEISQPTGWTPDYQLPNTDPNYKPVGRDEMNGVLFEITEALGQLQQFGFADWQNITGGWPVGANVNHGGGVWQSLANANTEEPGTGALWKPILFDDIGQATEAIPGLIQLATASQAQAGTNDANSMTPLKTAGLFPFRGIQVYDTPGTYTWTVPAGVTKAWVTVVGGGGGGGSISGGRGGGGGAGGTALKLADVSGITSVEVAVGAAGGTSSFGSFCSASGGANGSSSASGPAGGLPGQGVGGDINVFGGHGADGNQSSYVAGTVGGGAGGDSYFGGGGRGAGGVGLNGSAPGAGGGGAATGGSGAAGLVLIQW